MYTPFPILELQAFYFELALKKETVSALKPYNLNHTFVKLCLNISNETFILLMSCLFNMRRSRDL